MKAFLSHSSRDKAFVENVAKAVGSASVELDSCTFEYGSLNAVAIQDALKRSDLFVLFVSASSIESSIVAHEATIAQELVARGLIERLLFVCIEEQAFERAHASWKAYNFVRREGSVKSIARLIQGTLVSIKAKQGSLEQPFVGRIADLEAAKEGLIDPNRADIHAIFVSGNTGIGRRTFARRLYRDVFPQVGHLMPEITIDRFDGLVELYRKIKSQLIREETISVLASDQMRFEGLSVSNKSTEIAELIARVVENREAIILRDLGGMLEDEGNFQPDLKDVIAKAPSYPHPPLILVADRTPPLFERAASENVLFCPLPSLDANSVRQLIAVRLKSIGVSYDEDQLESLVKLSDRHPFNVHFIMGYVEAYSLPVFLADPSPLTAWKHRRTAEFVGSVKFAPDQVTMLAILRHFPALDFSLLVEASKLSPQVVASNLVKLIDRHIVETGSETYFVSPPLQAAIDRDPRFRLPSDQLRQALSSIGNALVAAGPDTAVSVSMVDSAVLAMLQTEEGVPELYSAFLLPSHLVWLARRRYDDRKYKDAIRLSRDALQSQGRLSTAGTVEACRILCLAAARLGKSEDFARGMSVLDGLPVSPFTRSNGNFLKGFKARLDGHLPEAESFQRLAYKDAPRNFSIVRELAFICLARGKLKDAEMYARRAFQSAPDNFYILDILISTLTRLLKRAEASELEVEDLLDRLEKASQDHGRSFYETRKAEYELVRGRALEAARLIDKAIEKTPDLFNVRAIRARIYMARNNKAVASGEINKMSHLVRRGSMSDGKSNLRTLLEINAEFLVMCGDFDGARKLYNTQGVFDTHERAGALKVVDAAEAYAQKN